MWKPVCNFPNYEVSSNGEVRSTNYNHTGVCKILKPSISSNGYYGSSNGYYGVILVKEASRITGINQGSISKCCKGERRIAGGFRWRYEQEN